MYILILGQCMSITSCGPDTIKRHNKHKIPEATDSLTCTLVSSNIFTEERNKITINV